MNDADEVCQRAEIILGPVLHWWSDPFTFKGRLCTWLEPNYRHHERTAWSSQWTFQFVIVTFYSLVMSIIKSATEFCVWYDGFVAVLHYRTGNRTCNMDAVRLCLISELNRVNWVRFSSISSLIELTEKFLIRFCSITEPNGLSSIKFDWVRLPNVLLPVPNYCLIFLVQNRHKTI